MQAGFLQILILFTVCYQCMPTAISQIQIRYSVSTVEKNSFQSGPILHVFSSGCARIFPKKKCIVKKRENWRNSENLMQIFPTELPKITWSGSSILCSDIFAMDPVQYHILFSSIPDRPLWPPRWEHHRAIRKTQLSTWSMSLSYYWTEQWFPVVSDMYVTAKKCMEIESNLYYKLPRKPASIHSQTPGQVPNPLCSMFQPIPYRRGQCVLMSEDDLNFLFHIPNEEGTWYDHWF